MVDHHRSDERKSLHQGLRWHHREREGEAAVVRDLSPRGMFLTPIGVMPHQIAVGDVVWLAIRMRDEEHVLSAIVRWRGYSPTHQRDGFGLEFEKSSINTAEKLCLSLDHQGVFFVPGPGLSVAPHSNS
jgi:hypothetical protein